MSVWWTVQRQWLWEESGKPPAPVNPIVWAVDNKVSISVMYVSVTDFTLADNYAHIMFCPLVDYVHDVVLTVIKEDQR